MKLYKRILKAFGGAALYIDKKMLKCLGVGLDDELCIELQKDRIVITKSVMCDKKLRELFSAETTLTK